MPSTTAMPPCIRDHRTWTRVSEAEPLARCITCGDLSVAAGHALARDLADELPRREQNALNVAILLAVYSACCWTAATMTIIGGAP